MPIGTLYQDLIDQIITDLKTITPELVDDVGPPINPRVNKWKVSRTPKVGRYEIVVLAGPMEPIGGFTVKSSDNEFTIWIDLIFYSSAFETGFDSAMSVAERIYDKFHLKNISGLVRIAKVSLFPGDGQLAQRNLLAIPIRVGIKCEKVITQN